MAEALSTQKRIQKLLVCINLLIDEKQVVPTTPSTFPSDIIIAERLAMLNQEARDLLVIAERRGFVDLYRPVSGDIFVMLTEMGREALRVPEEYFQSPSTGSQSYHTVINSYQSPTVVNNQSHSTAITQYQQNNNPNTGDIAALIEQLVNAINKAPGIDQTEKEDLLSDVHLLEQATKQAKPNKNILDSIIKAAQEKLWNLLEKVSTDATKEELKLLFIQLTTQLHQTGLLDSVQHMLPK